MTFLFELFKGLGLVLTSDQIGKLEFVFAQLDPVERTGQIAQFLADVREGKTPTILEVLG
jgi:hypothetical protein